jgi:hypothetical protein
MKTTKFLMTLILTGLFAITINSCKKYDEGGLISKTEENLKTSWKLEKYLRNATEETSLLYIKNYQETYSGSDSYSRTYIDKKGDTKSENGTWKFDKEQKKIHISGVSSIDITDKTGTVSSSYYNIIKLDKDEYWYYFENGGDRHEFRFVK